MGSSPHPPILCPLCGSTHQLDDPIGKKNCILGQLSVLARGYRCPVQGVPVAHMHNTNCIAQQRQGTGAQQRTDNQTPEIFPFPLQLPGHAVQLRLYRPHQGCQGDQAIQDGGAGTGSVNNDYDAYPNEEQAIRDGGTGRVNSHCDAHLNEGHTIQTPIQMRSSPAPSEATTVRLDEILNLDSPRKDSPSLSEASMSHIDEFGIMSIPLENSPGLTEASMEHLNHFGTTPIPHEEPYRAQASMEPLDHFGTTPIEEGDPSQDQALTQNAYTSSMRHAFNLGSTEAGLHLLAEFNILPRPYQGRSASMPAEGNVRHYQHLVHGTELPPMPHRPESLPGSRSDWDAYQIWGEFPPPPGGRRGNTVEDCIIVDDDDEDNDSVHSDRTVTMSMIANRQNDTAILPSVEDTVLPSVEHYDDDDDDNDSVASDRTVTMSMIASRENNAAVVPSVEDNDMNSADDRLLPSVEDTLLPSVEDDQATSSSDIWGQS